MAPDRLLTRSETREMLGGISRSHLSNLIAGKVKNTPRLPVVKIGRCQFVRERAVWEWISEVEKLCRNGHR